MSPENGAEGSLPESNEQAINISQKLTVEEERARFRQRLEDAETETMAHDPAVPTKAPRNPDSIPDVKTVLINSNFIGLLPGGYLREQVGIDYDKALFSALDDACIECGLDLNAIREMNAKISELSGLLRIVPKPGERFISYTEEQREVAERRKAFRMELEMMVLPVFDLLLSKGYSLEDLGGV